MYITRRVLAFFFSIAIMIFFFAMVVSPYTSLEFADAQYYSSSDDDDDDDDDNGGGTAFGSNQTGGFAFLPGTNPNFPGFIGPGNRTNSTGVIDPGVVVPPPPLGNTLILVPVPAGPPLPPPPPPPPPLQVGSLDLRTVSGCPLLDSPGGNLIVLYDGEVREMGRTPDGTSIIILLEGGARVGYLDIETCPSAFE